MTSDARFTGAIPEIYDRYLGPCLFEPFAADMAERFRGFSGRLLETAAGTGRVTRALARSVAKGATIVATDLNEPMLARAMAVVSADNVEWKPADALSLPFGNSSFEAVVCQFGVMFFPDKIRGFSEARRVLSPGGRFVFSVWGPLEETELSLAVQEAVEAIFPDDPPVFMRRTPHGYRDEGEIRRALEQAGFTRVAGERVEKPTPASSAADFARGLCTGSPLRNEIEARRPGQVDAVAEQVARALTDRYGEGPVARAATALVVTAS